MLSAYWRAVVTVIPVLSRHRFTVALFLTKTCKMSRSKKGVCNVSSGLRLHCAVITADKNPNTINLSFINRFGPYQGFIARALFSVVFYIPNSIYRWICVLLQRYLQSYVCFLSCEHIHALYSTLCVCMHWDVCCFCWFLPGEDPETRRMRTVKNIADLRQNLEETMSSLRGTQISHRYIAYV